jgi:threonine dehydrogenase-like Zn-dependent dehydrogenase
VGRSRAVPALTHLTQATCEYCRRGLQTSCPRGGQWGLDGGQGEATRVPYADGVLVKLPVAEDSELIPDLLTLSDVLCTGYHAARTAGVRAGESVAVIGDGAVGLCAVISARLLGAGRIILMGRHAPRTDLGRQLGATDVVADRGQDGIDAVRELTGGTGTDRVLECVGLKDALAQSAGVVRDGGTISRVGAPQCPEVPFGFPEFRRNLNLTGGIAPARAYLEELMPHILSGQIHPRRVFDRTMPLSQVAEAYRLMNDREALKVLIRP